MNDHDREDNTTPNEEEEVEEPTWGKRDLVEYIRTSAAATEEDIDEGDAAWARYNMREASNLWDLAYTIELLPDDDERIRRLVQEYPDDVADIDELLDAGPGIHPSAWPPLPPLVEELGLDMQFDTPGAELRHAATRMHETREALKDVKPEHATHRDFAKTLAQIRALVADATRTLEQLGER